MIFITAASNQETGVMLKRMAIESREIHSGVSFFNGKLCGTSIMLVQTGVGPKKAKTAATQIVKHYSPSIILSVGAGGAVDPALHTGDIVLIKKVLQKNGPVHNMQKSSVKYYVGCHKKISQDACRLLQQAGLSTVWGDCLTSEQFVHLKAKKQWIYTMFNVKLVEMENAALARVFSAADIPFIALCVISDTARENTVDFSSLVAQKKRLGLAGVMVHFLKNPQDIFRAAQFNRAMRRVRKKLYHTAAILVKGLSRPLSTNKNV